MELDENYSKVGDIIGKICEVFEGEMQEKGLKLVRKLEAKHQDIMCDATKLEELFTNLISNAVKYTPSGGTISISTCELPCDKEGFVTIQSVIADTGIGMNEEFLPHLFEPFARERNTTMGKILGTGLGMPIVKSLVDLMGGTIEVESHPGKGSKFTVTLTHQLADLDYYERKTELSVSEKIESFAGKRILLAEDNDLNAEIAITILGNMGFIVERAVDGIDCINKVQKNPAGTYDLIFMDIQMPNMNGYKATLKIRTLPDKEKANIPIVAMTANAFAEDKEKALKVGMNGHIVKPIDAAVIEKTLISIWE